jgi:hypothetical protein
MLMKSLLEWWRERQQVRQEMHDDAVAYQRMLADIQDLCVWCVDFPEVEASASWLLLRDQQRRWKPGEPLPAGPYWGPIGTFHDQLVVRRSQRRHR